LLNVMKALANAGQTPKLRFVKSYNGEIECVAVDVEPPRPSAEMAVVGAEEEAPDSAALSIEDGQWAAVRNDTPVYYNGEWCVWGNLAGNERMTCTFNADGVLVGGDPF
jgi:hypothetical protein